MIKLKNILSEAYAWERQDGKALPTLAEVQAAYDKRMREEAKPDYIDIDGDGDETEDMKKAVADKKAKADAPVDEAKRKRKKVKGSGMHFNNDDDDAGDGMSESDGMCEACGTMRESCSCDHDSDSADISRLNMGGTMDESKFWGRVKGNVNGHEYILREAFRK